MITFDLYYVDSLQDIDRLREPEVSRGESTEFFNILRDCVSDRMQILYLRYFNEMDPDRTVGFVLFDKLTNQMLGHSANLKDDDLDNVYRDIQNTLNLLDRHKIT